MSDVADAAVLDSRQQFTIANSDQVRDELQEYIERDLLGPWDGDTEVLPPRSQCPGERDGSFAGLAEIRLSAVAKISAVDLTTEPGGGWLLGR